MKLRSILFCGMLGLAWLFGGVTSRDGLMGITRVKAQTTSPQAPEQDCPDWDIDVIFKRAREATSCAAAYEVIVQCASGAGSDGALAGIIVDRCEGTFLGRMKQAERKRYQTAKRGCERKHVDETGSLGLSLRANCAASLARTTAQRFEPRTGQP